ncbi:hypothetical protein LCGC14_0617670 [marine sediment metagenome]|uniref:Uncharacterized protein n=1 Tax=marine sediment metagenome TaxID=412755 RepID=A0A0F9R5T5_9ZZZZ
MIFRRKKPELNIEEIIKNVENVVTSLNLNYLYGRLTLYELTEVHDKYEIFNKSKDSKKFIYFSYWLSGYLLGFHRNGNALDRLYKYLGDKKND